LIEARNGGESAIHNIRNDLKEVESVLTEDDKTKINDAITSLETAIKGDDVDAIQKAVTDLFQTSSVVAEAKSKAEQESAQSKSNADNVVDAEFTNFKEKTRYTETDTV
jgi:molecular chaperone DnaK